MPISATTHEVHDLDDVTIAQCEGRVRVPVTENGPVVLDDYKPRIDAKAAQKSRNRAVTAHLPWCSVHHERDRFCCFRRLNHTLKYSA